MSKIKKLLEEQIEHVFDNFVKDRDLSRNEAYIKLLRLGYDEDKAWAELGEADPWARTE